MHFQNSNLHKVGVGLLKLKLFDRALDAFKRGAAETGCIPCILEYVKGHIHTRGNMIHLRLPWLLEGAIRGHTSCMSMLNDTCCNDSKQINALALGNYWARLFISMYPNMPPTPTTAKGRILKKKSEPVVSFARRQMLTRITT
jgi:hypothetical protein